MLTRYAVRRTPRRERPTRSLAAAPGIGGDALIATECGLLTLADLAAPSAAEVRVLVDRRAGADDILVRSENALWEMAPKVGGTFTTPACLTAEACCTETVHVVTESGLTLTCAAGQEILTTQGWIAAGLLEPGYHQVLVQGGCGGFEGDAGLPFVPPAEVTGSGGRTRRYNFPADWSDDLGFALGWLTAGGWLRGDHQHSQVRFTFTRLQQGELARIKSAVNGWYGAGVREAERPAGGLQLTYYGQTIVEFFEALDLPPGPVEERRVPASLFGAPVAAVTGFLRAIYSATGCLPAGGANRYAAEMRLRHRSRALLTGVQALLLHLGVRARLNDGRRATRLPAAGAYRPERPRDGRATPELIVSGSALTGLRAILGCSVEPSRAAVRWGPRRPPAGEEPVDEVASVAPAGEQTVYCPVEPITHSLIANGLVVWAGA